MVESSDPHGWMYGGIGAAAFSTILGVGLFGFYDNHIFAGGFLTFIGAAGLISMALMLKGTPITIAHCAIAALLATWALFAYDIWFVPKSTGITQDEVHAQVNEATRPLRDQIDKLTQKLALTTTERDEAKRHAEVDAPHTPSNTSVVNTLSAGAALVTNLAALFSKHSILAFSITAPADNDQFRNWLYKTIVDACHSAQNITAGQHCIIEPVQPYPKNPTLENPAQSVPDPQYPGILVHTTSTGAEFRDLQ